MNCPKCGGEVKAKKVITVSIDRGIGYDDYKLQAMMCANNKCKFLFLFETV
jgi:hypothetical protein